MNCLLGINIIEKEAIITYNNCKILQYTKEEFADVQEEEKLGCLQKREGEGVQTIRVGRSLGRWRERLWGGELDDER